MLDYANACWFLKPAPAYVLGGKHGDIVQMLGAFHALWRRTGRRPTVITSATYAPTFEGASYVNVVDVPLPWDATVQQLMASAAVQDAIVLQPWNDPDAPEFRAGVGPTLLRVGSRPFHADPRDPHYGACMMRRAGFDEALASHLRPVFDRRDPVREAALVTRCIGRVTKPVLLVALDGQSSPWGYLPEYHAHLAPFYRDFHVVDVGKLRCHRVYDMLALMEVASGLLTIDTLALHLASATQLPYVAFTNDGWLGSVPKGNCVLNVRYSASLRRLHSVIAVLNKWRNERSINGRTPAASTTLNDQCHADQSSKVSRNPST